MSEEKEESGMSAIVKAVIGAITTAIAAGGAWFAGLFGGGGGEATSNTPAPAPVVVNVQQNQENKQQTKQSNSAPMVIKERVIEKPAAESKPAAPAAKPQADEEDPW